MEVLAAGQSIGWLLNLDDGLGDRLISRTGYLFNVVRQIGVLSGDMAWYSEAGCKEDVSYYADGAWIPAQGIVFRTSGKAYYVPRGSVSAYRPYASIYYTYIWGPGDGQCVDETGTAYDSVVALPNDPAVTGVSGTTFALPIVFGIP